MATSRLFSHVTSLSSSLLRSSQRFCIIRSSNCGSPSLLFPSSASRPRRRSSIFSIIRLQSYASSAVVFDGVSEDPPPPPASSSSSSSSSHPWPEWEHFVDKLRMKGYFAVSNSSPELNSETASDEHAAHSTMELNRLKNACLKFARERFDILRSLPKEDIQAVVVYGCPNVLRKAVNSSKRLRLYLQVDEGDVCGSCSKRESCDKAYIIPDEKEGARTVDVVRILLAYAVNPQSLMVSGSPVSKDVQDSARNLLSELIRLSDTTIDPSLAKPVVVTSIQKKEPSQKVIAKHKQPSNIETKRGDWLCPSCNFLNFARNVRCLECKEEGPKKVNFSGAEMKQGDWTCPKCEFMNFARNKMCFRCRETRPKRELNPGEWECPSCDYVNFRGNKVCKKCNCIRPEDEENPLEDHFWRKPHISAGSETLKFGDDDGGDVDDNDDILPLEGQKKFVVTKRATPSGRRFTASRMRR